MATYTKFNAFVENLAEKVHNLGADSLVVALSNTAPTATNAVLTDITQISYTNLSSRALTVSSSAQTSGTYKLVLSDLTLTASGAVATFRYIIIYNDTPTSPADPLIAFYDYGSSITMANGETFTLDFDGTNGLFTLA
jgi:hypothetical protein